MLVIFECISKEIPISPTVLLLTSACVFDSCLLHEIVMNAYQHVLLHFDDNSLSIELLLYFVEKLLEIDVIVIFLKHNFYVAELLLLAIL